MVRRAQEVAEIALKSALREVGVEVPRVHDVGVILKDHASRFPDALRGESDRMASISRRLSRERELSFYGDERMGTAPQHLYTHEDAQQALADAQTVLGWSRRLLSAGR